MKKFIELNAAEAIKVYKELDLTQEANIILETNENKDLETVRWPWNRDPRAWEHSGYAYGFIAESTSGSNNLDITEAKNITADNTLKNSRITVSLDFLRVYDYPGKGLHRVLFKFNATNYLVEQEQNISFNQTFPIREGQRAPISGYPIFIGLNTGNELVRFDVEIINVSNDSDDKFLEAMNSGVVKNGIKLLNTVNPVMSVITEYATGITAMIAKRNKNIEIIAPKMGLYFGNTPTKMKLSAGVYIAVQTSNPELFKWSEWKFNRTTGSFEKANGTPGEIPYNYFVFSISKSV